MTPRRTRAWLGVAVIGVALVVSGTNVVAVTGHGPSSSFGTATNGSITVDVSLNAAATADGRTVTGPPRIDPSLDGPPTDPDSDGNYEDLNGNGRTDFDDVVVLFEYIDDPAVTDHVSVYDFNMNGRVDYDDIITLFEEV